MTTTRPWLDSYSSWTPAHLDYGDETLVSMYERTVSRHASRPVTWFMGQSMTYAELDREVLKAAAGLRSFGVRRGDRVALAMPNCPQHVIAFYAVLRLGAVVVEHNPLYTAAELQGPFENHGARVAIVWDKAAHVFEKLRSSTELQAIVAVNLIEAMPPLKRFALRIPLPQIRDMHNELHGVAQHSVAWETFLGTTIGGDGTDLDFPTDITPDEPAVIMYTSGTTGTPKGAQLSHRNLYSNVLMGKHWVEHSGEVRERALASLPFFHAYGLSMAMTLIFLLGGEIVLIPSPKPPLIKDAFKKRHPTWFSGVPLLFEKTIEIAENDPKVSLDSVRVAFCGAATLPAEIVQKWENTTSGMFLEGYGLTETSPVIVGTPMNDNRKPGYIGVPFPDTDVRIADTENPTQVLGYNEEGEVQVKGPQVFTGYFNNPEATEKAFVDGWFRTGDIGVMDEDGFVKLVSRLKEVIITGGFNVYPPEVEEVLLSHPDVAEVAVVGRPRKDGSEDVVACVVLNDGAALDPEGLKDFARERLTRYKVPRTFYHFEELTRNMMGKLSRKEIRAELLEKINR